MGMNTNDTNLFVSGITASLGYPIPSIAYEAFLLYLIRKQPLKDIPALFRRLIAFYPPHHGHPLANHSDRIGCAAVQSWPSLHTTIVARALALEQLRCSLAPCQSCFEGRHKHRSYPVMKVVTTVRTLRGGWPP